MIEFVRIWALLFCLLPIAVLYILPAKPSRQALRVPDSVTARLEAIANVGAERTTARRENFAPHVFGWIALIIALAGPQTRGEELLAPSGRDLILAIDFSASMGAQDMPVADGLTDRISVTRDLVGAFAGTLLGDRIALIAFASEAYVVAPLTFDSEAVSQIIDELAVGLPGRKTDLGRAIGSTVKLFQDVPLSERFLVIISDGETNAGGLSALDAAMLAKEQGIVIHMIGFAETVEANSESHMREIAKLTGGAFHLAATPSELQQALTRIQEIALPVEQSERRYIVRDWSWVFLALAFVTATYVGWREVKEG